MAQVSSIRFRVTLESPAALGPPTSLPTTPDNRGLRWSGTSVKGALRHCFKQMSGVDQKLEDALFGSENHRGKISVGDLEFEGWTETRMRVAIDRFTGAADDKTLWQQELVPAGAMMLGELLIEDDVPPHAVTAVNSSLGMLELVGIGRRRGQGQCIVDILRARDFPVLFVSYAHEDADHKAWVRALADRLLKDGVEVIIDAYELRVGDHIERFMDKAIAKAGKVLAVLTPEYKRKAEAKLDGVGFECAAIERSLKADDSGNTKVIPLLRKGTVHLSIPNGLRGMLWLEMSGDEFEEAKYAELNAVVLGLAARRPKSRFSGAKPANA